MKVIGLLGGMSWESTVPYYRVINDTVRQRLGGLHSAKIVLYSVDFFEIAQLQRAGNWDGAGQAMIAAARALERAGAECLAICTNTMHKLVPAIEPAIGIPVLHIVDAAAAAVKAQKIQTVGLLGTQFTMEHGFYRDRLRERHGLTVVIPDDADRAQIHRIIFDELCVGIVRDESRAAYRRIIAQLVQRGAQGIVLGCTEQAMLVTPEDAPVPMFDTTRLHALYAAEWALA
jgi:aspartate racemase